MLMFLHLLSDLLNSKGTVDKSVSNGGPSFSKSYDIPMPNKQTDDYFNFDNDKEIEIRVQTNNDYNKEKNETSMNSKKTDTYSENGLFSKMNQIYQIKSSTIQTLQLRNGQRRTKSWIILVLEL